MALGLGGIGILLFAVGMVINAIFASFVPGMDGHTFEQIHAAEDRSFQQGFADRLLPLLVISMGLTGYGYYEALNEKRGGKAR